MTLTLTLTPRVRASRRTWRAAGDLTDLCGLMALWLEGHLATRPGYPGPCDVDEDLVPTLAAACRAGWLTSVSQPGTLGPAWDGSPHQDRAYITGYATAPVADDLVALAGRAGLLAVVQPPARVAGLRPSRVPVTRHRGREEQWVGERTPPMQIRGDWRGLTGPALTALTEAHQVTLIDPVWGRDELWQRLDDALAGAR